MDFLFSSQINRLAFLGRYLLAVVPQVLGYYLCSVAITSSGSDWSGSTYLAVGFGAVLILIGTIYYVAFAVLPRMESIGMPRWYGFALLTLLPTILLRLAAANDWVSQDDLTLCTWICLPFVLIGALFGIGLFILPENSFRGGNITQAILYDFEVGSGRVLLRVAPVLVGFAFILGLYDFGSPFAPGYLGLNDAQSMDNAQLARQIARGEGFTTEFLRPHAVAQIRAFQAPPAVPGGDLGELFPTSRFPPGRPAFCRTLITRRAIPTCWPPGSR